MTILHVSATTGTLISNNLYKLFGHMTILCSSSTCRFSATLPKLHKYWIVYQSRCYIDLQILIIIGGDRIRIKHVIKKLLMF